MKNTITYKTSVNFLFPFIRLLFVLLSLIGLLVLNYYAFKDGDGRYAVVIILSLSIGYFITIELFYFLKYTKSYVFLEGEIREYNYIFFKEKRISIDHITGYKKSKIDYKGFCQRVILLYLKNGEKILMLQSNYFNFKEIENQVENLHIQYLGEYEYSWFYLVV